MDQVIGTAAGRDRLRILFVTSWYPEPDRPMAGAFIRDHARAVARLAEVTVLHLAGSRGMRRMASGAVLEDDQAERQAWGLDTFRVRHPRPPRGAGYMAFVAWGLWAIEQVWDASGPFDVIHAHVFRAGPASALAAGRHQVPMLLTEHSSAVARGTLRRVDRLAATAAYRLADLLCPVSENLGRAMRKIAPNIPMRLVGNAVDLDVFRPPDFSNDERGDALRMLFVGRLHEVKGVDILFDALQIVEGDPQTSMRWRLDLVGDGPLRAHLSRLAREGGFADRVRFMGYLPREEVAEAMRHADLFVLPSRWENMPCVLLEAMASGLPVAASLVGGIPEVVTPDVGELAHPEDPADLARVLRSFVVGQRRFHRAAIADRGRRFGLDAIGNQLMDCYRSVVRR